MVAACAVSAAAQDSPWRLDTSFAAALPLLVAALRQRLQRGDAQTVAVLTAVVASVGPGEAGGLGGLATLPADLVTSCAQCVQIYADLLLRWGFCVERAELLKHAPPHFALPHGRARAGVASSASVDFELSAAEAPPPAAGAAAAAGAAEGAGATGGLGEPSSHGSWSLGAHGWRKSVTAPTAQAARVPAPACGTGPKAPQERGRPLPRCAVCLTRVAGLSWFCSSCGHGGHLKCIADWFSTHRGTECPTGCGCRCQHAATLPTADQVCAMATDAAVASGAQGSAPAASSTPREAPEKGGAAGASPPRGGQAPSSGGSNSSPRASRHTRRDSGGSGGEPSRKSCRSKRGSAGVGTDSGLWSSYE